jgi:phosphoglycolate phosphatase-like HAD superfamily hydrolase
VLFDLNGTLVDDVPRATRSTNRALAACALPALSERRFRDAFRLPLEDFFAGLGVPAGRRGDAVTTWNAAMAEETAPLMPGTCRVLDHLKRTGIGTGLVSAAGRPSVHSDLRHHGIDALLDVVHCEIADKRAVLAAEVATAGAAVLYVGDTEYDVACARDAGAWPVAVGAGYTDGERLRTAAPWRLLADLDGLTHTLPA